MPLRPIHFRPLAGLFASALLAAAVLLAPSRPALAFSPAGSEMLPVTGQVSVTSRIGTETISLNGTATIQRGDAQLQGGVEVVPAEIIALTLSGTSLTGAISVGESTTLASAGELRALQPSSSFPASSFFDVYALVIVPASPGGPVVLQNSTALHMVASDNLTEWPPVSASYAATPDPCVPLAPPLPKQICITGLAFTTSGGTLAVGGMASLPDIGRAAASDRDAARGDTAAGMAIGLAGLVAAGLAGWYARRVLVHRR